MKSENLASFFESYTLTVLKFSSEADSVQITILPFPTPFLSPFPFFFLCLGGFQGPIIPYEVINSNRRPSPSWKRNNMRDIHRMNWIFIKFPRNKDSLGREGCRGFSQLSRVHYLVLMHLMAFTYTSVVV